jgi:hypothetical protein
MVVKQAVREQGGGQARKRIIRQRKLEAVYGMERGCCIHTHRHI